MAQSYGNTSTSAITAATDEIMGVESTSQKLGTSLSDVSPTSDAVTGTVTIKVDDATVAATVTITALTEKQDIAAAIETQMQAAAVSAPAIAASYSGFTCRYDAILDRYILTSGTAPDGFEEPDPPNPDIHHAARVEVTGGTAAAALKLGAANGGREAYETAEVIDYVVKYRFSFDGGARFGGADITVLSEDMADPTDTNELETIANARASQIKAEKIASNSPLSAGYVDTLNGPVTL